MERIIVCVAFLMSESPPDEVDDVERDQKRPDDREIDLLNFVVSEIELQVADDCAYQPYYQRDDNVPHS